MLHAELVRIGLGEPDADLIADVVACPGADSCKLAITSSNQAGYTMREEMIKFDYADPQVQEVQVKISGCPNGCGQHHMAGIGLQGSSYKVGKIEVPCYDVFVGGAGYQGSAATQRASRASWRRRRIWPSTACSASTRLSAPRPARHSSTSSTALAPKHFEKPLEEFKWVGSLADDAEMYMDWGHTDLFEVIRGEGECAVGDVPLVRTIEAPIEL